MTHFAFLLLLVLPLAVAAQTKSPAPATSKGKPTAVELLRAEARKVGPIAAGQFRAVVLEANARLSHRDFSTRAEAVQYANDAVSESDDNPPIAGVFDPQLQLVHQGAAAR
jgi:hypothetical protein